MDYDMFTTSDPIYHHCPPRQPQTMAPQFKSNSELAPNCPRCASPNTKFCYYNNYSLSQPRYFCKGCRRYWTKGGSLRNVPVGGGCRKSRRAKAARSSENRRMGGPGTRPHGPASPDHNDPSGPAGPDIDLADVFAKFLTQSGGEEANSSSSNSDNGSEGHVTVADHVIQEDIRGFLGDQDYELRDQNVVDGLMGQVDPNLFGLQALLNGDQGEEDISWSDGTTSGGFENSSSWEPIFQEMASFSCGDEDDQLLKIHNGLVGDCWNSFDLSAYI